MSSLLTGAVLPTWRYTESRGSDVACTAPADGPLVPGAVGALVTLRGGRAVLPLAGPRCLARRGKFAQPPIAPADRP